jgi:drug/metabolite transporter (DMT)-like permease
MKLKDWLAFIVLGTLWGSSFMWIKIAVQETSPILVVAIRLSFAILTLIAAAIIARQTMPKSGRMWLILTIFGFVNVAFPYLLITWGEQYIDSAIAAVLNSTTPLFAMVIAHFTLADDRISAPKLVGLIVGFLGILILISRDLNRSTILEGNPMLLILGQGAVLLASFLYAGSAVFARRNLKSLSHIEQGLVPLLVSTLSLWMVAAIVKDPLSLPELPITWISLAWLGILGSGLAFLLYFYLIHSVGPTRSTLVTYIFPLVGVALGVLILGEKLDLRLFVGSILIVGSIIVVNSTK